MDDALLVGLLERLGDLPGDRDGLVDGDRPALQPLREVLALDELHGEQVRAAAAREGRLLEAVQVGDVRVVERGEQLRLALEAGEAVGVRREGLRQELQRDVPAEPRVRRAPDLSHPAGADGGGDLVRPEACAGGEGQRETPVCLSGNGRHSTG